MVGLVFLDLCKAILNKGGRDGSRNTYLLIDMHVDSHFWVHIQASCCWFFEHNEMRGRFFNVHSMHISQEFAQLLFAPVYSTKLRQNWLQSTTVPWLFWSIISEHQVLL